jgi:hypothetical protein
MGHNPSRLNASTPFFDSTGKCGASIEVGRDINTYALK